jgi:hypothetical protein
MISTQPHKEEEDKNQLRTNHQSRENTKNAKITELKGHLSKTYSAG